MREDRLLKLAGLLEADANNPTGLKFDLNVWAAPIEVAADPADQYTRDQHGWKADTLIPLDCNTAACAVGVACLSGAFKDEGLSYEVDMGMLSPIFEKYSSFEAVREFFDLGQADVNYLFVSDSYKSIAQKGRHGELAVAARIRQYVADGGSY